MMRPTTVNRFKPSGDRSDLASRFHDHVHFTYNLNEAVLYNKLHRLLKPRTHLPSAGG